MRGQRKNPRKAVQPFENKKRKIDIFKNYEANGVEKIQRKLEIFSTLISKKSTQLACLFKLRSAYALKGSPLSEDDIDGLYPVYTPVHEKTLGKVLNKFFTKKGGVFIDIRIESQIEKRKEHQLNIEQLIEKEVQKRVARALAGMKGGLSKSRNRKNQNTLVSEGEILISEVQEEQQAFCEEPEDLKQTGSVSNFVSALNS